MGTEGGGGWGGEGFSFQLPCQTEGPSLKGNKAPTYTTGAQDTRILTHTSSFPCKATGSDRDEERKDRALGCHGWMSGPIFAKIYFFHGTSFDPAPPCLLRVLFDRHGSLKLWLLSDFQTPIMIKKKSVSGRGKIKRKQVLSSFFSFSCISSYFTLSLSPSLPPSLCHLKSPGFFSCLFK